MVTSAVRLRLSPYFRSPPKSPVLRLWNGEATVVSVVTDDTTYGFSSRLRDRAGVVKPWSVAATCICASPDGPYAAGMGVTPEYCFFQRMARRNLIPQICGPLSR